MQLAMHTYNQERIARQRRPLQVGMGLHTGSLIMGIIGDDTRTDAATISDTVNTASRMENLTKYYGTAILLSEQCKKELKKPEAFQFRYLGKVDVKGKQDPVGIFECLDALPEEEKVQKIAAGEAFSNALNYYQSHQFSKAIVAFEQIIEANPEDAVSKCFLREATLKLRQS
jgi:TolA-binding protein